MPRARVLLPFIGLALTAAGRALAQQGPPASTGADSRELRPAVVVRGSIVVDGQGTDPAWAEAAPVDGFVERDPREGAEPTEQTRVRVARDDRALYFLIEAIDSEPGRIRGLLTRRDEPSPSDLVEVWLDPQDDRRTAYRFIVNARGVKRDSRLSSGGEVEDANWDGVWEAQTQRTATGWTAELRIPFSQLGRDARASAWGVQVARRLQRNNELSVLAPTPKSAARPLEYTARLMDMGDAPTSRRLELVPYAVAAFEDDAGRPGGFGRAGGDARLSLGASDLLHVTVWPDFAQVEADPSQLNLSAFEIFLPERRQFFLEGQELFRFPLALRNWDNETLYYSRRIGARPTRDVGEEDDVLAYPRETSILGAAKVTGRRHDGTSYGALVALTEPERALIATRDGPRRPLVAPRAAYVLARARRELDHQGSAVGVTATHVARELTQETRSVFVEHATTGGVDFDLRQGDIALLGHLAGSDLSGSAVAIDEVQRSTTHLMQRPDADYLRYDPSRTHLSGWAAELVGGKLDGVPWRGGWNVRARSPGFDPNDLGYLQRDDQQHAEAWIERRMDRPGRWYRSIFMDSAVWLDKTFGTEVTGSGISASMSTHFAGNANAWFGAIRRNRLLDVTLLRGGPAFLLPGGWSAWTGLWSDDRRPVQVGVGADLTTRDQGNYLFQATSVTLKARPTSALLLSLAPRYEHTFDDLQFVNGDDPEAIVLGRLLRDTFSFTARASWALALGLTLEAYAMPYVSVGRYRRFYQVVAPRAQEYSDRVARTDYAGDDRISFGQLRSNLVLRWDYDPGSSLSLVWSHEQTSDSDAVARLGVLEHGRELSNAPSFDVVMLKLAQYLVL